MTKQYKPGTTREQQNIIKQFFYGTTVDGLVKEYQNSHMVKSEVTGKDIRMPKKMAKEIIYEALKLIDWEV